MFLSNTPVCVYRVAVLSFCWSATVRSNVFAARAVSRSLQRQPLRLACASHDRVKHVSRGDSPRQDVGHPRQHVGLCHRGALGAEQVHHHSVAQAPQFPEGARQEGLRRSTPASDVCNRTTPPGKNLAQRIPCLGETGVVFARGVARSTVMSTVSAESQVALTKQKVDSMVSKLKSMVKKADAKKEITVAMLKTKTRCKVCGGR
jgi:hypothetical protein